MKEDQLLENNICPNCWGKQEYDGKFVEAARDRQIDINNNDNVSTRAFIQDFVTKHLDGIRLKKEDNHRICPACKAKY